MSNAQDTATYIEQDCVYNHEGRGFEAGGAVVTDAYAIGYVKGVQQRFSREFYGEIEITDWHGVTLGTGRIIKSWRWHSFLSSHCHQIEARIHGVPYTGRSAGNGMLWKGKRKANQG